MIIRNLNNQQILNKKMVQNLHNFRLHLIWHEIFKYELDSDTFKYFEIKFEP